MAPAMKIAQLLWGQPHISKLTAVDALFQNVARL
jgi:hypothetical protein